MYGALSNYKEEWENVGEQLMMFFVYTYFCGAVYDDMVCSKMEMALFSIRWIQEFLILLVKFFANMMVFFFIFPKSHFCAP